MKQGSPTTRNAGGRGDADQRRQLAGSAFSPALHFSV